MLFNSIEFLLFFLLFFAVYWMLRRRVAVQNVWLLAASYAFYGWWDVRFLLLIFITTLSTYITAICAERANRRTWTAANIVLNLAILATFKYFNFFSENLQRLFAAFGWNIDWVTLDILLPVGISFYTLQAIGYSVDVYRGECSAERNFVDFATFIAYFPQLVAGPIERSRALLPQICRSRHWDYPLAVQGLREMLWGLFKKVVVADGLSQYVDWCFNHTLPHTALGWTMACTFFTLQIYCDFSGYSNMARGISRMLGIELMVNFRTPYFSTDIAELWRRWHISLMSWLRDYVYIPLGGSRRGAVRTSINIAIVFLLSGLWHGAQWCFVLWGAYWAVLNVVWRPFHHRGEVPRHQGAGNAITMVLMIIGLVIFRCENLAELPEIFAKVLPGIICVGGVIWLLWQIMPRFSFTVRFVLGWSLCAFVVVACCADIELIPLTVLWLPRLCAVAVLWAEAETQHLSFPLEHMPARTWKRYCIYWLLILLIVTVSYEGQQFIYFQF